MLRCSTLLQNFSQATMTAITWLKCNCCKVLVVLILSIILPAAIVGLFSVAITCSTYECYLYTNTIPVITSCMGMPVISSAVGFIVIMYYAYMVNTGQEEQFWNKILTVIKLVFSNFIKNRTVKRRRKSSLCLVMKLCLKRCTG